MAPATPLDKICEDARSLLAHRLRKEYPYLKQSALEQILSNAVGEITSGMKQQEVPMAQSKARINFFSLSAEMRNRIYGYVLDITPGVISDRYIASHYPGWFRLPSLLQVSRQMRSETLPMHLGSRTFTVEIDWYFEEKVHLKLSRWLRAIGPELASRILKIKVIVTRDAWWIPLQYQDDTGRLFDHVRDASKSGVLEKLDLLDLGVPIERFTVAYDEADVDVGERSKLIELDDY